MFPRSSIFSLKPWKIKLGIKTERNIITPDLIDLPDGLLSPDVSHGIVEARDSNSESIETFVSAVDSHNGGSGVGLGHPPIPLQHHDLRPDLVIDALPLVPDLLDVVLERELDFNSVTQSNEVLT